MKKLRKQPLPKPVEAVGTLDEYYEKLLALGYKHLGSGLYSRVYGKGGHAIKVCIGDAAYNDYLQYVLANQDNPTFPKVYDVKRFKNVKRRETVVWNWDTDLDVTVVTMEKLKPLQPRKQRHISHHFDIRWNRAFAKPKDKTEERMFDVLHALQRKGYSIDMHAGNVMLRGDQPVIVDPAI